MSDNDNEQRAMTTAPSYRRVLLKLSGEALMGDQQYGIDLPTLEHMAADIRVVHDMGVQVCLVVGGGNIFRGLTESSKGMDRASADYVGMLATVMNAVSLQDAIERAGVTTRVQSAIPMSQLAEPYIRRRAMRHLEKGRVVIFAAGTGNPYFTTDTAAALRAAEVHADLIMKATKVDGVYSADPHQDHSAERFEQLSYEEAIRRNLQFMDQTAIQLCRQNRLPIVVFDMTAPGNIRRVVCGEKVGTLVSE